LVGQSLGGGILGGEVTASNSHIFLAPTQFLVHFNTNSQAVTSLAVATSFTAAAAVLASLPAWRPSYGKS
jgi:hypothetical protein